MECNQKETKNFSLLTYKILSDALMLLLIAFSLFLLAESILPGLVSSHLSFLKIVLIIFTVLGLIIFLGRKDNFQFSGLDKKNPPSRLLRWTGLPASKQNQKIFFVLIIFFLVLTANSLFRFSPWEILIITPLSCFVLIYFYKVISAF